MAKEDEEKKNIPVVNSNDNKVEQNSKKKKKKKNSAPKNNNQSNQNNQEKNKDNNKQNNKDKNTDKVKNNQNNKKNNNQSNKKNNKKENKPKNDSTNKPKDTKVEEKVKQEKVEELKVEEVKEVEKEVPVTEEVVEVLDEPVIEKVEEVQSVVEEPTQMQPQPVMEPVNNIAYNVPNQVSVPEKKKKKFPFVKIVVIILVLVVLGGGTYLGLYYYNNYVIPNKYIEDIKSNYNDGNYENVSEYKDKLTRIYNYVQNSREYKEIEDLVLYSEAHVNYDKKQYNECLTVADSFNDMAKDEHEDLINECRYELGKEQLDKGEYEDSYDTLGKVKNKDDVAKLREEALFKYCEKLLEDEKFDLAAEKLENVSDEYEGKAELATKIKYGKAKSLFNEEKYLDAKEIFLTIKDYEDSQSYIDKIRMYQAEEYIKENKVIKARNVYNTLPDGIEFNGISSTMRKKQFEKYKKVISLSGKYKATKVYEETRNVWNYNGDWDSWYINKPNENEVLEFIVTMKDDGTISAEVSFSFYAFEDYSSLSAYCNAKYQFNSFKIGNVTSLASSYKADSHTKVTFSNNKFNLSYYKRDDYSVNFHNIYSSKVTYGKKIENY